MRATDADFGINGEVTYSIVYGSNEDGIFEIDSDTGVITLTKPLGKILSDALCMSDVT